MPESIERRLADLRLVLPEEPKLPPGVTIPFEWVRVSTAIGVVTVPLNLPLVVSAEVHLS